MKPKTTLRNAEERTASGYARCARAGTTTLAAACLAIKIGSAGNNQNAAAIVRPTDAPYSASVGNHQKNTRADADNVRP